MSRLLRIPSLSRERQIGQYRLTSEAGKGRFSTVYLAEDGTGQKVALKVQSAGNAIGRTLAANEAEALRRIGWPYSARLIEADLGSRPFIAMEYLDGTDLRRSMRRGGLDPVSGLRIASRLCDAIEAIHSRGIVHRDLKPKNVMVGDSVKVIDFDHAYVEGIEDFTKALPNRFGNAVYGAPEVQNGNGDPRQDIFSLGIMLYELSMKRSGTRITDTARLMEVRDGKVHAVPRQVAAIVKKATMKDASSRYISAALMRADIEKALKKAIKG